jgi:hypothetical protein
MQLESTRCGANAHIKIDWDFVDATIWLDTAHGGPGPEVHNAAVEALMAALPSTHILASNDFSGAYHYRAVPYD